MTEVGVAYPRYLHTSVPLELVERTCPLTGVVTCGYKAAGVGSTFRHPESHLRRWRARHLQFSRRLYRKQGIKHIAAMLITRQLYGSRASNTSPQYDA